MQEFIFILIILAVTLLPSIVKAIAKNAAKNQGEDDPYVYYEEEEERVPEVFRPGGNLPPIQEPTAASSSPTANRQNAVFEKNKAQTARSFYGNEGGRITANSIDDATPLVLADKDDEPGGLLDEFDLRAAVIYSELLKPKFED